MVRAITDFTGMWQWEAGQTVQLLNKIMPENLNKPVENYGRTVGELGWHLVEGTISAAKELGFQIKSPLTREEALNDVQQLVTAYEQTMKSFADVVANNWTDDQLPENVKIWGFEMQKGHVLTSLELHQAHHRGQMTVLMRLLNNPIAGIYGPIREEMEAMMQAKQN